MPRFVILEHAPGAASRAGLHWDLMLEQGAILRTWSLASPPAVGLQQFAAQLPDHRPAYLDHEGPIAGDRGSVARWDQGDYQMIETTDDRLIVELRGARISGLLRLSRTASDQDSPQRWLLELSSG